jgi:hypothetical protein
VRSRRQTTPPKNGVLHKRDCEREWGSAEKLDDAEEEPE